MGESPNIVNASHLPSLAPMSFFQIILLLFNIYRRNFLIFILIVSLINVPLIVLNFAVSEAPPTDVNSVNDILSGRFDIQKQESAKRVKRSESKSAILSALTDISLNFLNFIIIGPLVTIITSENRLGRNPPLQVVLHLFKKRFLYLIGASILVLLLFSAAWMIITILGFFCFLPLLLFIVLIYYFLSYIFFSTQVFILEDVGINMGFSRALALARARFWPNFVLFGSVYLMASILGLLYVFVGVWYTKGNFNYNSPALHSAVMISTILLTPILPIGSTLLYYDSRIRLEGLGSALESLTLPEPRINNLVSPPPCLPSIVGQDAINILALGSIILVVALLYLSVIFTLIVISSL